LAVIHCPEDLLLYSTKLPGANDASELSAASSPLGVSQGESGRGSWPSTPSNTGGWNRGKFGPIEKFLMYYENIEREKAGIQLEA